MDKWPKQFPELTLEQKRISDDFMHYWHEVLPHQYTLIERFNHGYPVKRFLIDKEPGKKYRTLEIGAGTGEHIYHEDLTNQDYYAIEIRDVMADEIKKRFPNVITIVGDIQKGNDIEDGFFNRIVAVHVLEHLKNLPAAVDECYRILKPNGMFHVVIPCEGGVAYSFCRKISAERLFKKRYHMDYSWFISREHVNQPFEIIEELEKKFVIKNKQYFPFIIPSTNFNLVIGLDLISKKKVENQNESY